MAENVLANRTTASAMEKLAADKAKTRRVWSLAIEILCLDKVARDLCFVSHRGVYRDRYQANIS